jgi:hypothetical protein
MKRDMSGQSRARVRASHWYHWPHYALTGRLVIRVSRITEPHFRASCYPSEARGNGVEVRLTQRLTFYAMDLFKTGDFTTPTAALRVGQAN